MSTVYLGIGSNVDVDRNLRAGINALRETFGAVSLSPAYRSAAVGFSGHDFINLVARIESPMQPLELKEVLNRLEDAHGRRRDVPKFSDRTLDIDILMIDDLWLHCPGLVLPRAEILQYAHVLKPFADIAPDLPHPVTGISIARHWQNFEGDRASVVRVADPA